MIISVMRFANKEELRQRRKVFLDGFFMDFCTYLVRFVHNVSYLCTDICQKPFRSCSERNNGRCQNEWLVRKPFCLLKSFKTGAPNILPWCWKTKQVPFKEKKIGHVIVFFFFSDRRESWSPAQDRIQLINSKKVTTIEDFWLTERMLESLVASGSKRKNSRVVWLFIFWRSPSGFSYIECRTNF